MRRVLGARHRIVSNLKVLPFLPKPAIARFPFLPVRDGAEAPARRGNSAQVTAAAAFFHLVHTEEKQPSVDIGLKTTQDLTGEL